MRYWVLLFGIVSWGVYGNDVLRSAVSTNFPDGLHTQYLTYFADKLHVPSEIGTMPYARRLRSIDNGTLDIMVGVSTLLIHNGLVVKYVEDGDWWGKPLCE